jgi:hypothetical protein
MILVPPLIFCFLLLLAHPQSVLQIVFETVLVVDDASFSFLVPYSIFRSFTALLCDRDTRVDPAESRPLPSKWLNRVKKK